MRERAHRYEHDSDHDVANHDVPGRRSASASLRSTDAPVPSGILMRKGTGATSEDADGAVAAASGGGGFGLPDNLRGRFEDSLGTDLSGVRLHTGAESEQAAGAVGARAYTLGNDIHFNAGEYDPSSEGGQHLLAHEVAHTVQQRGGAPHRQNKLAVSQPSDSFEIEADRAADAMVRGAPASVGGSSMVLARKEGDKPAAGGAAAGGEGGEKEKKRYPSWKDGALTIPVFPKLGGNVVMKKTDGGQDANVSLSKDVKAKLFEQKYSQGVQIAPGITGSITGSIGASLGVSATASANGTWVKAEGEEEESLVLGIQGKGEVALTAKGSLQLSAGVGIANVLAIEGGIKGELTAKASASVALGGSLTLDPKGGEKGIVLFSVGVGADLSASASLVADVVIPGDRVNVYEQTLGKLDIGKASILCTTQYANGTLTDLPPVCTAQWLPVPALDKRPKRKLSDAEKKRYVEDQMEVDKGASGGSAESPTPAPDEVEMTDQEIYDEGSKLAVDMLVRHQNKILTVTDNDTAGAGVSVNVDGGPVRGTAIYPKKMRENDPYEGRKLKKGTSGAINSWSSVGFPSVTIVEKCAKSPAAVARHLLSNHIDLEIIGLTFEYDTIPKKERKFETCKVNEGQDPPTPISPVDVEQRPTIRQGY